jgi:predicted nucleotidyltransferase component of viral defense system
MPPGTMALMSQRRSALYASCERRRRCKHNLRRIASATGMKPYLRLIAPSFARGTATATFYQLSYANPNETAAHLRSTIQVELNYSALRRPWIDLPVASFIAEAFNRSPEITSIACVSVAETAAEKLVSLTRRTAMELAGVARVRDPTLVRHIYDLHVTSAYYDATEVAQLAREINAARRRGICQSVSSVS